MSRLFGWQWFMTRGEGGLLGRGGGRTAWLAALLAGLRLPGLVQGDGGAKRAPLRGEGGVAYDT